MHRWMHHIIKYCENFHCKSYDCESNPYYFNVEHTSDGQWTENINAITMWEFEMLSIISTLYHRDGNGPLWCVIEGYCACVKDSFGLLFTWVWKLKRCQDKLFWWSRPMAFENEICDEVYDARIFTLLFVCWLFYCFIHK